MLDPRLLRDDPESVRASQRARREDPGLVDAVLAADEQRRAAIAAYDRLRAEQKTVGREVAKASGDEKAALLARTKALAADVKAAEVTQNERSAAYDSLLRQLSNVAEPGVPEGGEDDYVVLEHVGEVPEFDFEPRDHLDLGQLLGAIDTERGAKVSGARFYFLTGVGAQLQLDLVVSRNGLVIPDPESSPAGRIGAIGVDPSDREVHLCQAPRREIRLLSVNGDVTDAPTMRFHYRARDRKADTHAACLRCHERLENLFPQLGWDTRTVVGDGQFVWVYLQSATPGQEMKLANTDAGAASTDLIGQFLTTPRSKYTATDAGEDKVGARTARAIVLLAKPGQSLPFVRAKVWVDATDGLIRQFESTDANGVTRKVRLLTVRPNATVDDSIFTFEVPAGVRVVQP